MNTITTVSGKFYSGMNANTAKNQDIYKSKFSRDFCNIDKNKDGILSPEEILKERKLEAKRKEFWGLVNIGFLTLDLLSVPFFKGKNKVLKADKLDLLIDIPLGFLGISSLLNSQKIKKENKEIQKELNLYT